MITDFSKTALWLEKNCDKKHTISLKEMGKSFKKKIIVDKNKLVYEVFIKRLPPIDVALTVIQAGDFAGEHFMTRGHYHRKSVPEFYILLEGKGILLLQKNGNVVVKNLKKGVVVEIHGDVAHRLINNGKTPLKVMTVYDENRKADYSVNFKRRFFA